MPSPIPLMLPKFSVYDIIIHMIFSTQIELESFAEQLGAFLKTQKLPLVLELVGDVGAGKTTFTKALAKGLGVKDPVTSPSFTISKRYSANNLTLIHYDFYRLPDPGLMAEDLAESLVDPCALTVLEWADSVHDILPKNHLKITFKVLGNNSRRLTFNKPMEKLYGTIS